MTDDNAPTHPSQHLDAQDLDQVAGACAPVPAPVEADAGADAQGVQEFHPERIPAHDAPGEMSGGPLGDGLHTHLW